jgi:N-acetylglucosamine kinase-like BadF-type ATPase
MEASDFVVGLDIGTTKIAAIVGRKNEYGKIEILAIGKAPSLGVKRGVVSNIEDTIRSIKAAVADALAKDITIKTSAGESQVFKLEQVCEPSAPWHDHAPGQYGGGSFSERRRSPDR